MKLKLFKSAQRRLDQKLLKQQVGHAVNRALASGRGRVWSAGNISIKEENGSGYRYTASVGFERTRKGPQHVIDKQWARIQQIAEAAVRSKGWYTSEPSRNGKAEAKDTASQGKAFAEVKINTDPADYFSHLYDRDSQVEIVLSSIDEYVRSGYENRFHTLLFGDPACGKTEILRSVTRMVGPSAVLHFDATSTTKAGAQKVLLESAEVPPILCIEEIEKTDEASLRWLLSVLDYRGEIRKTTFREDSVKKVKLLCLATANDYELFNKIMDGALASRFSSKVYCSRPSREVLHKILEREILAHKGKAEWIEPALDWCLDKEHTNDPRRIITVCLSGKDKLLSGEYQKHLEKVLPPTRPKLYNSDN